MINQDEVTTIYECYRRAMASVGYNIQLPSDTDPTKTYAFRAINKFIVQTKQWNLSHEITRALVREVVLYGKKKGLLKKGTALLNMKSVLQICHDYLTKQLANENALIVDVLRMKKFVDKNLINNNLMETLNFRTKKDGYSNLVQWYNSGDLTLSFIAISISCRKTLNLLPLDERILFPSDEKLLRYRIKILKDNSIKAKLANIMNDDLLIIGI